MQESSAAVAGHVISLASPKAALQAQQWGGAHFQDKADHEVGLQEPARDAAGGFLPGMFSLWVSLTEQ